METISASQCLSLQSGGTSRKVKEKGHAAITEAVFDIGGQPNTTLPSSLYPTFTSFTQSDIKYNEAHRKQQKLHTKK